MDGLLESLTPLASLLSRTSDPCEASAALWRALDSSNPVRMDQVLPAYFGADAEWVRAALASAGVTRARETDRRVVLAQCEVLALQIRRMRSTAPALVMTVPDFLRRAWTEHLRDLPAADWPRETLPALLDIASQAQHDLVLAAPFFDVAHTLALASRIARLTRAGGNVLIVTQGTDGPGLSANAAPLQLLRGARREPGQLRVWSWAGPTLGVHFKALVADRKYGYLGSANHTSHGALHHAEAGIVLHGPLAHQLDNWLRKVAAQPAKHPNGT